MTREVDVVSGANDVVSVRRRRINPGRNEDVQVVFQRNRLIDQFDVALVNAPVPFGDLVDVELAARVRDLRKFNSLV